MSPTLPSGYARFRLPGASVVALETARAMVSRILAGAGTLHEHASTAPAAKPLLGRGVSWAFDSDGERWVVRHYRRGGALAKRLGDRYARGGASRPARELRASTAARSRGVPTPEVIAYAIYPAGTFYRADIVTRWVPDSEDLASLTFGPDGRVSSLREAAWAAAGQLLHVTFEAGVHHPDLNLRNILIGDVSTSPAAWLIDLDRCVVKSQTSERARERMLERLHRSRRKLEARFRRPIDAASLAAFAEQLRG